MKHKIADACTYNDKIYFFDDEWQALCEFCVIDKSTKILAVNDSDILNTYHIFLDKNDLYITCTQSTEFLKYNLKTGKLIFITNNKIEKCLKSSCFYDYHMISNHKLWYFPGSQNKSVFYYDFKRNCFIENRVLKNTSFLENKEKLTQFSSGLEDTYWSACYKTNKYLKYDLRKQIVTIYETSDNTIHIDTISFDGENLWMTDAENSTIYKCTEVGEVIEKYEVNKDSTGGLFSRLFCIEQYIIGVPRFGKFILFINKSEKKFKKLYLQDLNINIDENIDKRSKILKCLKCKDKIFFFGFGIDALIITDIDGSNAHSIPIVYTKQDIARINYTKIIRSNNIIENKSMDLYRFISAMNFAELNYKNKEHRSSIGNSIYKKII